MPQFYPDGPAAVSLRSIQDGGGINTPPPENFDTPGLQGTMQQLLSENLGKFVIADFLVGVSTLVRRVGILYSVGSGFLVLYLDEYKAFEVCDIFSLKFVTFFPPGSEPSLDELLTGAAGSGILNTNPNGLSSLDNSSVQPRTATRTGRTGDMSSSMPAMATSGMSGSGMSGSGNSGRNGSPSGCRTLGQR